MASNLDPSIMQDFLTESGELLTRLEGDLVVLERCPTDPEMLNQVFRALHTIKGSASFLGLVNLVTIAHAAESALNSARNRVVNVDRRTMDLLLHAVDTIKRQMVQIESGEELCEADPNVVKALTAIGDGKSPTAPSAPSSPATAATTTDASGASWKPLALASSKADLLPYLISDLDETIEKLSATLASSSKDAAARKAAGSELGEQCDALIRAVEFFEFDPMLRLARAMAQAADAFASFDERSLNQVAPRCGAILEVMRRASAGLKQGRIGSWPTERLVERLTKVIAQGDLESGAQLPPGASVATALSVDGLDLDAAGSGGPTATKEESRPATAETPTPKDHPDERSASESTSPKKAGAVEQTIRVEVGRLETLMNLVGELVLQKNRISAISRQMDATTAESHAVREQMTLAAGGLDRVAADIQVAVMRTRMQPLEKLFGRYPRLIRDLASKTGKKIDLVVEGGETEVDKSVIEELGDPLVHLLRNAADHGLESPEERTSNGKGETGTLKLVASHEGSHVRVQVIDDGRGLNRERIAAKAIERGLSTPEAVAQLTDRQVYDFIFLPGFSTADQVSDLSGRGVGMDVVRTNVQKLKGTIELASTPGKGASVSITIPLTVAIMPAMMVSVATETYAVPLTNILEIVKLNEQRLASVGGRDVMRLRDSVLPLVSAARLFGYESKDPVAEPFAVILAMGDHRVGLKVTRLIGQQEIVVKPLDGEAQSKGPVSGATVRDDGGVSLIVDVAALLKRAEAQLA